MTAYPVARFIRTTRTLVDGQIPAYAPEALEDPLAAYAPFLYETKEAAEAELKDDVASHAETFEPEEEGDEDDYYDDDEILACTVHADGLITTDFFDLSREKIFSAYGVEDPAAGAKVKP